MLSFLVYPRVRPAFQQPLLGFWPGTLHHMHLADLALWGHSWCRVSHRYSPKVLWDPPGFSALSFCSRSATSWLPVGFFGTLEWNAARYPCYTGRESIGRDGSKASVRNLLCPLPLLLDHLVFASDTACQSWAGKKSILFSTELFLSPLFCEKRVSSECFKGSCFSDLWALHLHHFKAREIETSLCFVRVNHFIKKTKRFLNALSAPGRHLQITQSLVAAGFCSEQYNVMA